jgi:PAS domain S-box-containing protein
LLEYKPRATLYPEEVLSRKVLFFVGQQLFSLKGNWTWDLPAVELFCSDVIPAIQSSAIAVTKCIIHPDDLAEVQKVLHSEGHEPLNIHFRVITTWGKVYAIEGKGLFEIEKDERFLEQLQQKELDDFAHRQWQKEQQQKTSLQTTAYQYAELLTGHGIWYCNKSTNEVFYSDNLYRIYGLPPQSLNAHLHTFTHFIHPADKETVVDVFDKAYQAQVPLNIEYRILVNGQEEKYISLATKWVFSEKGEDVLLGVLADITERKNAEREAEQLSDSVKISEHLLRNDEALARTANWHINLFTRKIVYSDSIYRILGTRPTQFNTTILLSYVHPDDKEIVAEANKRIFSEHVVPEIEYRIIRPDGRIRHLRQKGKLVINAQKEMIIIGTTKDVTESLQAQQKLAALESRFLVYKLAVSESEDKAGIGICTWDLNSGEMEWSSGIYKLLGYKSSGVLPSHKLLLNFIHPEDRKLFTARTSEVINGLASDEIGFRMISRNETLYVKAYLRLVTDEGQNLLVMVFHNKTAEHHLQQSLDNQVQLTEMLSDASVDKVFVTDDNNYIIRWNRRCEEIFGLKKEKAIGQNLFDVFPQLKTPDYMDHLFRALRGEVVRINEAQGFLGPGYSDVSLNPIKHESGELLAVLHIIRNITREFELKLQLKERLGFIENLLEASIDRVIVLDKNMNYLYWNKRAEEYYNLQKGAVLGRNILDVSPGLINDPTYAEFRRALRGETVHISATQNLEARKGYFETYLIPVIDDKEAVTSILWIVHDLTREFQFQQQQKRADAILNNINEAYVEIDSEGIFRYINRRAEELWNINQDELVGKTVWDAFPENVEAEGYQTIIQALNEKTPVHKEYFSVGANRWIYMSATPTAEGAIILFYDIHELKESKQLLEAVFNAALYGIMLLKTIRNDQGEVQDFEVVLNNDMVRNWNGRDMVGERYGALFPKARENGIMEDYIQVLRTGQPMDREVLIEVPGVKTWYRVMAVRFGDDILAMAEDITIKKIIEGDISAINQQLQESQQQIQQIVDASPDIITIYDLQQGDAVYMNRTIGTVLGYTIDELRQMGFKGRSERVIHPDDLSALLAFNDGMHQASDDEVRAIEYRVICKDGDQKWIKNRSKVFKRDESGVPSHTISVLQDITEEKTLARQLQERTSFAEHLIDASIDRIFAIDPHYIIRAWNRKCEEYYGYRKDAVIGRSLTEIFPRLKESSEIMEAFARAIQGEQVSLPPEQELHHNAISERFLIPIQAEEGQDSVVLCILHDVTNDYLAREELALLNRELGRKNKELQDKHEEITTFAFVSSHDLKEPLRKIHTFSDWLILHEAEGLSLTGKKMLLRMAASVKRMEQLIDDILVLTKIHSDRHKEADVSLQEVVQRVQEEMSEKIAHTGAVIDADSLPAINGNENQLFYLFKNLLSNALKFQPEGNRPHVTIRAEKVAANALPEGLPAKADAPYLVVSVTDNGIGFDKKYARKIFQVFQRLHAPHQFTGSGMGLAICRKIMENHGGFINATSEEGRGSSFCCYFPLS